MNRDYYAGHQRGLAEGEERAIERIIKLLEQTKSPSHVWGGIAWSIALIKGESQKDNETVVLLTEGEK